MTAGEIAGDGEHFFGVHRKNGFLALGKRGQTNDAYY
jgi:hypothetical protein